MICRYLKCIVVGLAATATAAVGNSRAELATAPGPDDWCRSAEWMYWGAVDSQGRCDANRRDKDGQTPLALALIRGSPETVRAIVRAGADVNARLLGGPTPLTFAAGADSGLLKILLEAGADVNLPDANASTPLHHAADTTNARMLVEAGASLEARDQFAETPLAYAVRAGKLELVSYLLSLGANVNARDRDGASVLHVAVVSASPAIAELLRSRGAVDRKSFADDRDDHPTMSLIDAANGCNSAQVTMILDACRTSDTCNLEATDSNGLTALGWASARCDARLVQVLLDAGADAARSGRNPPLSAAASSGRTGVVMALLRAKADPNQRDSNGSTPLISAAVCPDPLMTRALLDAQADVNATDPQGMTAIFMAVLANNLPVAKLLLEAGADPNKALSDGTTPLKQARSRRMVEMEALLLERGAKD